MATKIYESTTITFFNGEQRYVTPLKIKHLRPFLDIFNKIKDIKDDGVDVLDLLLECGVVAMRQYYPEIDTKEKLEDSIDMKTLHEILDIAAGISTEDKENAEKKESSGKEDSGTDWKDLDLAALESEAFLLGIWKDYEDLESSLSLSELTAILNAKRDADYADKKFLASIQGIDLDEQNGGSKKEQDPWEAMKARVFGAPAGDPNDITNFQGKKAAEAGFGIGMGIGYKDLRAS
jgi:hypothetical protein